MRFPDTGSAVADTAVITLAVPSAKNFWLVVPDTPPPPRTMCTVPWALSMTSVWCDTGFGVSVSLPLTTPRTASDRS